jgi:hypothetical protein
MPTKAEKKQDQITARDNLNHYAPYIQDGSALLLISQDVGKGLTDYLRVSLAYTDDNGKVQSAFLTWSVAQVFGWVLRDRSGYMYIAMSGYGYSKPDEIARGLAMIYGVDRIRYELN